MSEYRLHPLVRVVVLLIFIAGMALAQPALLLAGAVMLASAFTLSGFPAMRRLSLMVMRLRWLLLAILLVYGWWMPGDLLFPRIGGISPTLQGLEHGLIRIAALICIVSAVHLLLQVTERGQLLAALMLITGSFLRPRTKERFAVRVLLTLEAVLQVQTMVSGVLQERPAGRRGVGSMVDALNTVYAAALQRAGDTPAAPIEVTEPGTPPRLQWLIPLSLAVLMWLLTAL